ncbi:MAG TPA: hypothetical protein VL688_05920 [Verrucomicrobiae bacterium]|jgi:hypothetical protein|nr:hypothetical protein [Verrucomicrobiae bacterium]
MKKTAALSVLLLAAFLAASPSLWAMGKRPKEAADAPRETKSFREMTAKEPPPDARDAQVTAGLIPEEKKES